MTYFQINRRIEISLPHSTEWYASRIEDLSSSTMSIAMPMRHGTPVFFSNNEKFQGKIITEGAAYCFVCTLLAKEISPLPIWSVSLPCNIKKIQMRAFVRLGIVLKVDISMISLGKEESSRTFFPVYTKNISGGGLQLASKEYMNIGTKINIRMTLPEYEMIETSAQVIRCQEQVAEDKLFFIGLKFLDLAENDRRNIIRFIYQKQLERKKMELD